MKIDSNNEKNEPENPREKLDQILRSVEDKGKNIVRIGRKVTEEGQNISDIAHATREVMKYARNVPDIENQIILWENVDYQAQTFLSKTNEESISPLISGSSTATISSSDFAFKKEVYLPYSDEDLPKLSTAITVLSELVMRASQEDEVIQLMVLLGLNTSPKGIKSPLELFQTAHESFTKPVVDSNPISTSLLPMRESIRLTIDYLLKHRPKQERTNKEWDKIVSIGNQLCFASISQEQIKSWAFIWTSDLQSSLSPAKEKDVSRDEWSNQIAKSTLFIKSFLSGIDPSKLR